MSEKAPPLLQPFAPTESGQYAPREKELAAMANWLSSDEQLLLITGPAGVGKSSLVRVFEHIHAEHFVGGIFNTISRKGAEHIFDQIEKHDFQKGPSLLVVDEFDFLDEESTRSIIRFGKNKPDLRVILSGRVIPNTMPDECGLRISLQLTPQDVYAFVVARLKDMDNRELADKVLNFVFNNTYLLFGGFFPTDELIKIIEKAFGELDLDSLRSAVEPPIPNLVVDEISESRNGHDRFGTALALVLFLVGTLSSSKSEDRLRSEIQKAEKVISEQMIKALPSQPNAKHVITTFVNFRGHPGVDEDNVITILSPNQLVEVISVDQGWAEIRYVNHINAETIEGWVHSKYLKPVRE
ncbi:MAG: SH3 domain-containing protein [Pseudomonadota bacterium]